MKTKLSAVAMFLLAFGTTYACKCKSPDTVPDAFEHTPFIVRGKVIQSTAVSFEETMLPKQVRKIKKALKGDSSALQLFESRVMVKSEVDVVAVFKGVARKKTVTIFTAQSSASCGYTFEEGREYVIYGTPHSNLYASFLPGSKQKANRGKKNTYWTNICTRTTDDVVRETAQLEMVRN